MISKVWKGGARSVGRKVDKCLLSEGERRGAAVGSGGAARRIDWQGLHAAPAGPYCLHA